jgi:Fur family ferric uptake transcriptional regulator
MRPSINPGRDAAPLLEILGRAGHRQTEPRRLVAALIARQTGHFTAADLSRTARAGKIAVGRATIFRTLELLGELEAIERIDLPTGDHAYVSCEPIHHHHAVCTECHRTVDIVDADLHAAIREAARRTGFTAEAHRIELYGRCAECAVRSASPRAGRDGPGAVGP